MPYIDVCPHDRRGQYTASLAGRVLVTSRQPFLDSARVLLEEGANPADTLVMRWAETGTESLRGQIGVAAKLTVWESPNGPKFRLYDGAPEIGESEEEPAPPETLPAAPPIDFEAPPLPGPIPEAERRPMSEPDIETAIPEYPIEAIPPPAPRGHWTDEHLTDPGYTYFVRAIHPIARIKIGTSLNPTQRVYELQTASCTALEVLKVIPGGYKMEAAWA
jgi:hypothetical protein